MAVRSLFWTSKFGRLKILEIQNGARRACQPETPLNQPCLSPAHAHMTPRPVTRRSPYTIDHHYPTCSPLGTLILAAVEQGSKASFSFSLAPRSPLFIAPSHCALLFASRWASTLCSATPPPMCHTPEQLDRAPLPRAARAILHESSWAKARTKTISRNPTPTSAVPHRWKLTFGHPPVHQHLQERRLHAAHLYNPQIIANDFRSELSPSSTCRRLPSPLLGHCGEPPSTLPTPTGFPWSGVPPRHHLLWWVTAGRPESAGKAPLRQWGKGSPILAANQKDQVDWTP
jgi:hypothetical protein